MVSFYASCYVFFWKDARVAESGGLENRYTFCWVSGVRIPLFPHKRIFGYISWRDVRVVEGARLEVVCARDGTEGSNPSLSVPGAMQNQPLEPRQVRKEAAVDWFDLCRSYPGFF